MKRHPILERHRVHYLHLKLYDMQDLLHSDEEEGWLGASLTGCVHGMLWAELCAPHSS